MSVIATNLDPMSSIKLHGVILGAVSNLVNSLPVLEDGSLDLTGVRLTYGDTSFLIETGIISEPVVLVDATPPDAIEVASVMGGVV